MIMGKIATTMSLMKASWQILKKDRELLLFPVLSGICCLSLMAIFIIQALDHGWLKPLAEQAAVGRKNTIYWFMFLFYYCNYLIIIFFNSAIIACAVIRMDGGDPTISDGLQAAVNRFPQIALWALIAATVGFLLGMVESGSRRGRSIIAGILGIAWSVVSYLAIPLIVVEKSNPLFAMDHSMEMMRRTWGEQVIGNFSFGLVFTLFALPVFPLMLLLNSKWGTPSLLPIFSVFIIYLIILAIFQSALQTIFNAVIYVFARDSKVPEGFSAGQLKEAMRRI
jgi:hypothetical protein